MSKQIKIFLVIGILLIVAVFTYWMWPEGEQASHRGVTTEDIGSTTE